MYHARLLDTRTLLPLPRRRHRFSDRLRHHHHAGTAAIRPVIDRAVRVLREIARIPRDQLINPFFPRPADDARFGKRIEHRREQRYHVELQHQ